MSGLTEAMGELMELACDHENSVVMDDDEAVASPIGQLENRILHMVAEAEPAEIDEALQVAAGRLDDVAPANIGLIAICLGAIIEDGGDAMVTGPGLLQWLPRILSDWVRFYTRCREMLAADAEVADILAERSDEVGDEYTLDDFMMDEGWVDIGEHCLPGLGPEGPALLAAPAALDYFQLSFVAHLSHSKELRRMTRERPELLQAAWDFDRTTGDSSYFTKMLRVLDDEPVVVIHPGERKGYELRIGGIAVNFELSLLLERELIGDPQAGWLCGQILTSDIADQDSSFVGQFNLWNWPGLGADETVPYDGFQRGLDGASLTEKVTKNWIWNEGCPADIMPFEGTRVILLGPPPYSRSYNGGRTFPNMEPELTVLRQLDRAEVDDWLARIAAAVRSATEG